MKKALLSLLHRWLGPSSDEQRKVTIFSLVFGALIGAYAILRPLKASLFIRSVGVGSIPNANLITLMLALPYSFACSYAVKKRDRLAITCSLFFFYSIVAFSVGLLLLNPFSIGAHHSATPEIQPTLGWFLYLMFDFYPIAITGTFWAYSNSICTPTFAKQNYGIITAYSRIAGFFIPLIGNIFLIQSSYVEHTTIAMLFFFAAFLIAFAGLLLKQITTILPESLTKGYADTFVQTINNTNHTDKQTDRLSQIKQFFEPYMIGIFGLIYSFECIAIMLDYHLQSLIAEQSNYSLTTMSSLLLYHTALIHGLAFCFAYRGVSFFARRYGMPFCLAITPLTVLGSMGLMLFFKNLPILFFITIFLKGLNFGFNAPLRQIILIPTTHKLQFATRGVVESLSKTLSKLSGSSFSLYTQLYGSHTAFAINAQAGLGVSALWVAIAWIIGNTYEKTMRNGEIIGSLPSKEN